MFALFRPLAGRPKDYFKLQITVLKTLGVSFSGNESLLYNVCSALWLGSVALTHTVVELYELYIYRDDLDKVVTILSYIGTDTLGVLKIGTLVYYRLEFGRIISDLEKGHFSPSIKRGGPIEEKLIKKCILTCNRQTSLYYLSVIMVIILGSLHSIYKRFLSGSNNWEMPFIPFSWFDVKRSPMYEIVCVYQVLWRGLYAMMVSSVDSLGACLLAHMSTQCEVLQNAIKRMVRNAYTDMFNVSSDTADFDPSLIHWAVLQKEMKSIVEYHQAIIKVADKFEEHFNMLMFAVFSGTLFILCFIMYDAALFDLLSVRAAQNFSYVALVMIQVFLYCFWGNELTLQSQKIASACWETDFVGTDVRFQKGLALIMRRSQKPIAPTAGKFAALSLQTYVWLIRASYSYYMVLRSQRI